MVVELQDRLSDKDKTSDLSLQIIGATKTSVVHALGNSWFASTISFSNSAGLCHFAAVFLG